MDSFKKLIFLFLFFTIVFTSCDIINPDEKIPGYIYIDTVIVNTNSNYQGSNSQNISDIWINIDGGYPGIYELPAKFPILETGSPKLTIRAGIKNNGIAASRVWYPFYTFYEIEPVIDENQITIIKPIVEYDENTDFLFLENFEDPGIKLISTSNSDTNIIHSNVDVFEGSRSGLIVLDNLHSVFECKAIDSLELKKDGTPVYLEMDYRSNLNINAPGNNSFTVGLYVSLPAGIVQEPIINLDSTSSRWNKIYIELTNNVVNHQDAYYFRLFIYAKKDSLHPDAQIALDNLKIVTFKE